MNLEFFIASRVGRASKKSFSKAILRLAVVAIALSMVVMIIATAIVAGFKNAISEKIFGFWGHIHITSNYAPSSYAFEGSPMNQNQDYYPVIDTVGQINYMLEGTDYSASLMYNLWTYDLGAALLLFSFLCWLIIAPKVLQKYLKPKLKRALISGLSLVIGILVLAHPYTILQKDVEHSSLGGINHIQSYASKEGIIKTKKQIEGIILRGVGADYNWDFLERYMEEGTVLDTKNEENNDILISTTTAKRLKLKLGDTFLVYFVQEGNSLARKFKITGIYKTGLEEYDRRFALVDIRKLQQLNNWRPYKNYGTELFLADERINLLGLTAATGQNWAMVRDRMTAGTVFDLSDSLSLQTVIPQRVASIHKVGVGDTLAVNYTSPELDKYTFKYQVAGIYNPPNEEALQKTIFVNWHSIDRLNTFLPPQVSGFEIFVDNLDDLEAMGNFTNYVVLMGKEQYANTIKELEPNIFDWLSLTDTNEKVILLFMILVSIINMTTSLMILILERTNMIGILKALGVQDWSIRKIFLYNAAYIVGYGLFWGNLIGIVLCLLQIQFGIISLPEDLYYISVAPVELNFFTILMLNVGTLVITLLVLIIPSWLVTRIDPVKAIRFS